VVMIVVIAIQYNSSYMPSEQPQGHSQKLHGVNAINCIRDKNEDSDNSHRASLGRKKCYFCVTQHEVG
jgi:hypothetical protein